jgi:hypothetical protein
MRQIPENLGFFEEILQGPAVGLFGLGGKRNDTAALLATGKIRR